MTDTEQHAVDQRPDPPNPDEASAMGVAAPPDAPGTTGRHSRRAGTVGTAGGVSAAELIARARAEVAADRPAGDVRRAAAVDDRPVGDVRRAAVVDDRPTGDARPAGHRRADPATAETALPNSLAAPLILLPPVIPPVLIPPDAALLEAIRVEAVRVEAVRVEAVRVEALRAGAVQAGVVQAGVVGAGATALDPLRPSPQTEMPVRHAVDAAVEAFEDRLHPEPMSVDPAVIAAKDRAGRNLPAAIAVGLGLAAVVLVPLLLYRPSFVVVAALASGVAVYEMATAIASVEARVSLPPLLLGAVAMDVAAWARGPDGLVGALLLTVLGLIVWRLADGATGYLRDVAAGQFVALYIPFLAGFAVLLARSHDGVARVVLLVLTVVCSDTGGYVAGVLRGRHPMARSVSPKKSWEGFGGSILASSLAGALVLRLTFHQPWWSGVVFGLAIAITATLGDLGESMIKRDLALKDMGRLLPGHGGLMDRLDSLLLCAPVAYLLLAATLGSTT